MFFLGDLISDLERTSPLNAYSRCSFQPSVCRSCGHCVCLKQASLQSPLCPSWSPCSSFHHSRTLLSAAQTPNRSWSSPPSLPGARRLPSLLSLHRTQLCPCWAGCHSVLALLLCLPVSPVSPLVPLCALASGAVVPMFALGSLSHQTRARM